MSTKKRSRPSPTADSAEAEVDDAALRKAMGKKTPARSKAPFTNGGCLGALTQTTAPSVGVVTLFSALALNYYLKNGTLALRGGPIMPGHPVWLPSTAAATQPEQPLHRSLQG